MTLKRFTVGGTTKKWLFTLLLGLGVTKPRTIFLLLPPLYLGFSIDIFNDPLKSYSMFSTVPKHFESNTKPSFAFLTDGCRRMITFGYQPHVIQT